MTEVGLCPQGNPTFRQGGKRCYEGFNGISRISHRTPTMASNRPRGFAEWNPQRKTRDLLFQVNSVLADFRDHLPVTARQVFYRLVAVFDYEKSDASYDRLLETLNRARRAGLVPMDSIRDDGATAVGLQRWDSAEEFLDNCHHWAKGFELDLQQDQQFYVEVLCEAAGMVPQLDRVARRYGIPVRSSGGFDSTTVKHQLGRFYGNKSQPVVILHLGDLDPSGEHIHLNLQDDVGAFAEHYGTFVDVRRVAVTAEHQAEFNLPTGIPKKDDKRAFDYDFTVQCEALPPDVLASILTTEIEATIDMDIWEQAVDRQAEIRDQLVEALDGISVL